VGSQDARAPARRRPRISFAPHEAFEVILTYAVIPTFDLVVEMPGGGVVIARRVIAPYRNQWALPGLRMFKPEGIEDALARIAEDELGLAVDVDGRRFLGQYVGRFATENGRQDLSTGYAVRALGREVRLNTAHFSGHRVIGSVGEAPAGTGAMYRYYLERYFNGAG
jgi:8-oxo-dGTP pyrophosphatase MutT (NUDIX family)